MQHNLRDARNIADAIRFRRDRVNFSPTSTIRDFNGIQNAMYKSGLEINNRSTKNIGNTIEEVKDFLKIPAPSVKAFAYASPEIQAECFLGPGDECILRLTSGLLNLLSQDELRFVIGHELGHFLLGHSGVFDSNEFWLSQAQEVSADRVGLLCAGSLEIALRAILKTTSGLGDELLTFNISEFVQQMRKFLEVACIKNNESTHPSMVLRSRALIWFSTSEYFLEYPEVQSGVSLSKIDDKVIFDFDKEKQVLNEAEKIQVEQDLMFWLSAEFIFNQGKFLKSTQKHLEQVVGVEKVGKLKSLLSNFTHSEVGEKIREGLSTAQARYDVTCKGESEQLKLKIISSIMEGSKKSY